MASEADENDEDDWSQKSWEDLLLKVLAKSYYFENACTYMYTLFKPMFHPVPSNDIVFGFYQRFLVQIRAHEFVQ